ncbi:MAG TPA: thioredoxin family protein [Chitinophagaceae bacterium]
MKQKLFAFIAFLFSFLTGFCQQEPAVQWKVTTQRLDSQQYIITASGTVPAGWQVYGMNPSVEGLEPVSFSFDYEKIKPAGQVRYSGDSAMIDDPVFSAKVKVFRGNITVSQLIRIADTVPPTATGVIRYFMAKEMEFLANEANFETTLEGATVKAASGDIRIQTIDLANPVSQCGDTSLQEKSLWGIFLLGFIGGLIGLLTPCVFPMIPVTVSFFTRRSRNKALAVRNGFFYGLFIFLIYLSASIPFHIAGNVQPEIFNNISTNVWLNAIFFVVFIVFAISFFGYFEITLPSGIANRADSKSGLGSIGGIFFMALTLVIVSFSCTGVILGSLLVGSISEGAWPLTAGLAGFGFALALPFALFAIFPHWLASLPRSGGWLDTVKKVLAFLELALALKFLSNADLVMHWGLLKREVFIGIWILISIGLALYLFGILHLPHDNRDEKPGLIRKLLGGLTILFILYLVPGLTQSKYANLKWLSGFPPPLSYSIYGKENVQNKGLEANVINNYAAALDSARRQNKPLLIDFTGWACVNCRKMEENVWTQPEVHDYISQHYILVSLYVDDREKLPVNERISYTTRDGQQKRIQTIGDKWATFQAENFNQVTQPLYVVLDTQERLLSHPVGYTPDWKEYLAWLKCGKETFDRLK